MDALYVRCEGEKEMWKREDSYEKKRGRGNTSSVGLAYLRKHSLGDKIGRYDLPHLHCREGKSDRHAENCNCLTVLMIHRPKISLHD